MALTIQLLWFAVSRVVPRDVCETITRGDSTGAVAVGLLNAACLTH